MREGLLTLDAVYQLDLGDEPWTVQILDGAMTLIASSEDWMNITDSNLSPTAAYLQRKLTVEGDIGLAIRFQAMLLWRSQ
jgi:putative sterol carrier protein